MGTQGVVSFVNQRSETIIKVITGCDGYNAAHFTQEIIDFGLDADLTLKNVFEIAKRYFSSEESLVVMNDKNIIMADGIEMEDEIQKKYRKTFKKPYWNPRWDHGTADYVIVAMVPFSFVD